MISKDTLYKKMKGDCSRECDIALDHKKCSNIFLIFFSQW